MEQNPYKSPADNLGPVRTHSEPRSKMLAIVCAGGACLFGIAALVAAWEGDMSPGGLFRIAWPLVASLGFALQTWGALSGRRWPRLLMGWALFVALIVFLTVSLL